MATCALHLNGDSLGVAYLDKGILDVGQFVEDAIVLDTLALLLDQIEPDSVLVSASANGAFLSAIERWAKHQHIAIIHKPASVFGGKAGKVAFGEITQMLEIRPEAIIPQTDKVALGCIGAILVHAGKTRVVAIRPLTLKGILNVPADVFSSCGIFPSGEGTLYGMFHPVTERGKALIRLWLRRPILDPSVISKRQTAVSLLMAHDSPLVQLRDKISPLQDAERSISQLRSQPTSTAFMVVINTLRLGMDLSKILKGTVLDIHMNSQLTQALSLLEDMLLIGDMIRVKAGVSLALDEARTQEANLADTLKKAQKRAGKKIILVPGAGFVAADGEDLLRCSVTAELDETLGDVSEKVRTEELKAEQMIVKRLEPCERAIVDLSRQIGELDALCAFALTARMNEWNAHPLIIYDGSPGFVLLEEFRHPVLEKKTKFSPLTFSVGIATEPQWHSNYQHLLLTGEHGSGKSTAAQSLVIGIILSLSGSFVPAKTIVVRNITSLHAVVATDDTAALGVSGFTNDCAKLVRLLSSTNKAWDSGNVPDEWRIAIVDELGRNTNPEAQRALTLALLRWYPGLLVMATNSGVTPPKNTLCLKMMGGTTRRGLCTTCNAVGAARRILGNEFADRVAELIDKY